MDFISIEFALLTILAPGVYYLIKPRYRPLFLSIISCGFITTFHYTLLIYVVSFSLLNFHFGKRIPYSKNKLLIYRIGIALNIVQLVVFRYSSFAIDPIFKVLNSPIQVSKISDIIITIGISYFTLQGIGYLTNIKMGWEKPEKKFSSLFLYIAFFPKFLSGPVERSNHFLPQISESVSFNYEDIHSGLRLMLYGFFRKIAIADQIAPFITKTFSNIEAVDGATLVILLLSLPIFLYFDFSGYTNIAIGAAKLFGIDLLPNFNRPFFSENMTMFWKRFHISLSSWFNDYVFRQESFRRRKWGIFASVYALLLTWILFGIWHGAGWNFMILGFLQAVAIIYEFFTKKWRSRLFSLVPVVLRTWLGRIITYVFYGSTLIFFFSPDIFTTKQFFSNVLNGSGSLVSVLINEIPMSAYFFTFIILFGEFIKEDLENLYNRIEKYWLLDYNFNVLLRWSVYSIVLTIIYILGNGGQEFIYVQF